MRWVGWRCMGVGWGDTGYLSKHFTPNSFWQAAIKLSDPRLFGLGQYLKIIFSFRVFEYDQNVGRMKILSWGNFRHIGFIKKDGAKKDFDKAIKIQFCRKWSKYIFNWEKCTFYAVVTWVKTSTGADRQLSNSLIPLKLSTPRPPPFIVEYGKYFQKYCLPREKNLRIYQWCIK